MMNKSTAKVVGQMVRMKSGLKRLFKLVQRITLYKVKNWVDIQICVHIYVQNVLRDNGTSEKPLIEI